jgi:hypothetical protein
MEINVIRTGLVIEPVDPKNPNQTGTRRKPEENWTTKPVNQKIPGWYF